MEELMLVRIDSDYCDYLRKYDSRVPYNYESKKLRPFIGVLFKVNDCMYFAPLSSLFHKPFLLSFLFYYKFLIAVLCVYIIVSVVLLFFSCDHVTPPLRSGGSS